MKVITYQTPLPGVTIDLCPRCAVSHTEYTLGPVSHGLHSGDCHDCGAGPISQEMEEYEVVEPERVVYCAQQPVVYAQHTHVLPPMTYGDACKLTAKWYNIPPNVSPSPVQGVRHWIDPLTSVWSIPTPPEWKRDAQIRLHGGLDPIAVWVWGGCMVVIRPRAAQLG